MNRNSTRTRRVCFESNRWQTQAGQWRLTCAGCGMHMDPVRDQWEADHWVRHADGGTDEQTQPLCIPCHKAKTQTDIREVAKRKRGTDRHFGIKRSRGFAKPKGAKFDWSTGRYTRESND